VLGGIIPLAVVLAKAAKGAYTRESHGAVRVLAWYWHFLDIVWLMMFATFWILG
jgi:cytochrome c oxidase subunit 3